MSERLPNDEFATAEPRGGRHRRIRTGRNRAGEFFKLMAISGVLAIAVLVGLKVADSGNLFTAAPSAPATVAVLDASNLDLSSAAATKLVDAGFEVASSSKLVDATNPNATQATTQVYASDSSYLDKANEVAKLLGTAVATVNAQATSPITVVIGTDFK